MFTIIWEREKKIKIWNKKQIPYSYKKDKRLKKMFQQHTLISILVISVFPFILYWMSLLYSIFFSRTGKNIVSRDFYECGFKVINDNFSVLDIQYSTLGLIFLIYEMEIILFVPLLLNYNSFSFAIIFFFFFLIFIIFFSYIYEWEKYSLAFTF